MFMLMISFSAKFEKLPSKPSVESSADMETQMAENGFVP